MCRIGFTTALIEQCQYLALTPISSSRTLVIINGPTFRNPFGRSFGLTGSGNPIGHTAIAIEGYGIFSFGNDTPLGSSVTDYLARQAQDRNSTVYILDTTEEQEQAMLTYLQQFSDPNGVSILGDNCTNRTITPLEDAGVPILDPGKFGMPIQPNVDRFPDSLQRGMGYLESQGKASQIYIGRGEEVPGVLRLFNPR